MLAPCAVNLSIGVPQLQIIMMEIGNGVEMVNLICMQLGKPFKQDDFLSVPTCPRPDVGELGPNMTEVGTVFQDTLAGDSIR